MADLAAALPEVREAVAVTGEWDVIAAVTDLDPMALETTVIRQVQELPGVVWTMTSPVVPTDSLGMSSGPPPAPPLQLTDEVVALVNVNFEPTMGERLVAELSSAPTVRGIVVLSGRYDALVEVGGDSWEAVVHAIFAEVQTAPGVVATATALAVTHGHSRNAKRRRGVASGPHLVEG